MTTNVTSRVVDKLSDFVERKLSREDTDTLVEAFTVLICTQAIHSHVSLFQLQELVAEVYRATAVQGAQAKVAALTLVRDNTPSREQIEAFAEKIRGNGLAPPGEAG